MPKSLKLPGYPDLYNLESRKGIILIAWYTLILHIICGFYFIDLYIGHASDSLISPLFEYSREYSESAALMIIIYSIFYTVFASLGLIKGVSAVSKCHFIDGYLGGTCH